MAASCTHVFKSGKQKGLICARETYGSTHCSKHSQNGKSSSPFGSGSSSSGNGTQFLETLEFLQFKLLALDTTLENKSIIIKRFRYLESLSPSSTEYQKNLNWLRHALNFPYNKMIKIPVSIQSGSEKDTAVTQYVVSVYKKLDQLIYGMKDVKEELMSFVCKRISNPDSSDHVLALHGTNGVGKTRLAYSLAKALDLPIRTINLGSVNDVSYFTGHGFTFVDSEVGRPVQILNETQCKNCIIYFDELDKVHQTEKGQAIYSYLTHLIDPTQNHKYQDVYLSGLELDMSKVFFVFSFNDMDLIDGTVKDRLKVITIKDPTFEDKVTIALEYIVPEICKNVNYEAKISKEIIEKIVRQDRSHSGLRGIKRVLEDVIGKLNVIRMLDDEVCEKLSYYGTSDESIMIKIIDKHSKEDDAYAGMYV